MLTAEEYQFEAWVKRPMLFRIMQKQGPWMLQPSVRSNIIEQVFLLLFNRIIMEVFAISHEKEVYSSVILIA